VRPAAQSPILEPSLVTSTVDRSTSDAEAGRGRVRKWRDRLPHGRMRWVALAAIGVIGIALVTSAVYAWWLGGGLVRVYTTAQAKSDIAQHRLELVEKRTKAGDVEAAERHLRVAQRAVADAKEVTQAPQVRVAKWLPFTRGTVSDMDHLLAAAEVVIDSADDALTLYGEFTASDSELFKDGQIDLEALESGRDAFDELQAALGKAREELLAVDGSGPLGGEALDKKRTGLKQVRQLRAQIKPFAPVVRALPAALGADGPKRYLVAVMNPAELRGSGGAPLSVALLVFEDGKLTVPLKGTTSLVTLGSPEGLLGDSPQLVWPRVKGDPFQPPLGEPQRFVNTNFNPDFRVSGEQMMRATPKFFGMRTDGVIALDVVALARLLDVIGPVESEYGQLTSQNLVDELLVKAYQEQGADVQGRQERNDELMSTMLSSLMAGGQLRAKADALLSVGPSRHFQMFFRDDRLQRMVERRGLAGAVPTPRVGNLTAVFTQNGNGSKLDVFQQRRIDQTIEVREDGSATVHRTVRLDNPSPPFTGEGRDIRRGYDTRWATNLVINLMPPGSRVTSEPTVDLISTVKQGKDQEGRTFAQAAVVAPPGGSVQVSWSYEVPRAAARVADAWRFRDVIVPQNTVRPFTLGTTVLAPKGWTTRRVDDSQLWYTADNLGNLQVEVATPQTWMLDLVPPAA